MEPVNIDSKMLVEKLNTWSNYPQIDQTNKLFLIHFQDSYFGEVPMMLHVPENYKKEHKSSLLLFLDEINPASSFEIAKSLVSENKVVSTSKSENIFFNYFRKQDLIILSPFADSQKKFEWSAPHIASLKNRNNKRINTTFRVLVDAIIKIKRSFNINDSKVFAFGHLGGADGVFYLALSQPSIFAGFILYNALFPDEKTCSNLAANMKNRSFYIVRSQSIQPLSIAKTRIFVKELEMRGAIIDYKEYPGNTNISHDLAIDLPFANKFILNKIRNPFPTSIYFEADNERYNEYYWIKVLDFDLSKRKPTWHVKFRQAKLNESLMPTINFSKHKGYAIKGSFKDNVFNISTSRIKSFEILISKKMVDLTKLIFVYVNGKLKVKRTVRLSSRFMLKSFEANFDKDAVWVNSIKISV